MKLREVIIEDAESATGSNDYEQMQAFVRANKVQGIPPEQQIALALFKELKKQKQQNANLSDELNDAERRIDQATQSGKLQGQELGMHKGELEKERKRGEQQKAEVGKLGQAYAEREQASQEQIQDITAKLDAVKSMPGVNKEAADKLEKQIQELTEKGMSIDHVEKLEQSIAAIQNMQVADEDAIKDLTDQVKTAQNTAAELEKTKQEFGGYISQATQTAEQQLALMQQQIAYLNQLSNQLNVAVTDVIPGSLENITAKVDELDGENEVVYDELQKHDAMLNQLTGTTEPAPAPAPAPAQTPAPQQQQRKPTMAVSPQLIGQRMVQSPQWQQEEPTFESAQLQKAIRWATGK